LLKESIYWHQKKGTKWLIEHALSELFERVELVEWFDYGGNPYFFKVIVSSSLNDPDLFRKVLAVVYELKNVRSWLEEFIIAKTSELPLWEASVTVRNVTNTIYLMERPSLSDEEIYIGMAVGHFITRMIAAPEE
jgi:P2-related tail formation protein